jgi:heterogeneous nuclear ribonucleoprotein L
MATAATFMQPFQQQVFAAGFDPAMLYAARQQLTQQRYMTPVGQFAGLPVGGFGNEPRVLMVYELPAEMNCYHLFNLFCQYGNVVKVKILINKQGTAMVEMDHPQAAASALRFLDETPILSGKLKMGYSKHMSIMPTPSPPMLQDGTPSYIDFTASRNNRFLTEEGGSKNRVIAPTKVLHFYNGPPDTTDTFISQAFSDRRVTPPIAVKVFNRGEKNAMGLLEWPEVKDAAYAMARVNHAELKSQSENTK